MLIVGKGQSMQVLTSNFKEYIILIKIYNYADWKKSYRR